MLVRIAIAGIVHALYYRMSYSTSSTTGAISWGPLWNEIWRRSFLKKVGYICSNIILQEILRHCGGHVVATSTIIIAAPDGAWRVIRVIRR